MRSAGSGRLHAQRESASKRTEAAAPERRSVVRGAQEDRAARCRGGAGLSGGVHACYTAVCVACAHPRRTDGPAKPTQGRTRRFWLRPLPPLPPHSPLSLCSAMSGPPHLSHAAEEEVLGGLTTEALMEEVGRRIECARKPERRAIFIGPRMTHSKAHGMQQREKKNQRGRKQKAAAAARHLPPARQTQPWSDPPLSLLFLCRCVFSAPYWSRSLSLSLPLSVSVGLCRCASPPWMLWRSGSDSVAVRPLSLAFCDCSRMR